MKCSTFPPRGRVFFFALCAMLILPLAFDRLVTLLAAEAQPPGKVYRIGFLSTNPLPASLWDALLDGLRERGYSEGRNLVFERRFSEGNAERFPELAAELVRLRVDCLIVTTAPAAIAAQNTTQTIPIVMPTMLDPVGAGLVASLARPGGAACPAGCAHQYAPPTHRCVRRPAAPAERGEHQGMGRGWWADVLWTEHS